MQMLGARVLCRGNVSSGVVAASGAPKLRCVTLLSPPEVCTAARTRSIFHAPSFRIGVSQRVQRRPGVATMATAKLDLEAFGKAASGSGSPSDVRGDCPFSQRIYLDLEEKGLPYKATFIEEGDNKPDWFIEKNPSGLIPVLRDGDQWIQDSDKIAQHLESKFPSPPLKTPPDFKQVGSGIFPLFTSWLKSKNPDDESKGKLVSELKSLDEHLKKNGPYIGGANPTDSDYALIPKLRHAKTALKYYYNFAIPAQYTALNSYIQLLTERPSFKKTDSPDDMIIEGWAKKFELPGKLVQTA